jgi:hypothetical protein
LLSNFWFCPIGPSGCKNDCGTKSAPREPILKLRRDALWGAESADGAQEEQATGWWSTGTAVAAGHD